MGNLCPKEDAEKLHHVVLQTQGAVGVVSRETVLPLQDPGGQASTLLK